MCRCPFHSILFTAPSSLPASLALFLPLYSEGIGRVSVWKQSGRRARHSAVHLNQTSTTAPCVIKCISFAFFCFVTERQLNKGGDSDRKLSKKTTTKREPKPKPKPQSSICTEAVGNRNPSPVPLRRKSSGKQAKLGHRMSSYIALLGLFVLLMLPILYETSHIFRYYFKFLIYYGIVSFNSIVLIPAFLTRPCDVRNLLWV